jgi:hypothetical protein
MTITMKPLHVASVGGQLLRFFNTPLEDGRPDLPWHAVDDLHHLLGLNRDARRFFLRKLRKRGGVETVATSDGVVTVAPHYMAQGTIDAMVEKRMAPASIRDEYEHAGAEALQKLGVPFPLPSDGWMAWMKAAMNRHEGRS